MDGDTGTDRREELIALQQSLARIAQELHDVSGRVDRALADGESAHVGDEDQQRAGGDETLPTPPFGTPMVPGPGVARRPGMTPNPAPPVTGYPIPATPAATVSPVSPMPPPSRPHVPAGHAPASPAAAGRRGPVPPLPGVSAAPTVSAPAGSGPPGSWADTAGLKVLGWVGGGVTVLGIVLLLVIAANDGGLSPAGRVAIGLVLGAALCGVGVFLHRHPDRAALGLTVASTGLAVGYLTVIGAVQAADLAPPVVGFIGSAVIVAVAVLISQSWREPWLAGVSFLVSGLLAPVVGGGLTDAVLVFEAIMVAGGALCLLLGVGLPSWSGAGLAAGLIYLSSVVDTGTTPARLLVVVVVAAVAWATMMARWDTGRVPADPGPFPLRMPSRDPAQVARDYADFHVHQRQRSLARLDAVVGALSLAISAGLVVVAVAELDAPGRLDAASAVTAGVLALIFGLLAWAGRRERALQPRAVTVTAWSATIALVGVALLRAVGGDARSVAWVMLAAVALTVAGADRSSRLLWPALGAALVALASTGTVIHPVDLLVSRSPGLVGPGGLLARGWTAVLPTGLAVIVMCAMAWWAISRCTADADPRRLAEPTSPSAPSVTGGPWPMAPADRTHLLAWSLVGCVVVTIYGVLAVTMVLAYAISPTVGGYQAGQAVVTALITVAALVLLWRGAHHVVLRIGGLGLAALAVTKLMLFDTQSLSPMPRALTVLGVGVLLLLGAMVYLRAVGRNDA